MARKSVLGKGLSALIQDAGTGASMAVAGREIRDVPLDQLACNPDQPRKTFNKEKLEELAASLKDVGVLQPVLVRRLRAGEVVASVVDGGPTPSYIIVAGERRVRAARIADLGAVPAITCSYEETEALRIGLLENIQREDLGPIEEAAAYEGLIRAYGATQEELAGMLGKNRSTVANALRLLTLEDEIQELVEEGVLTRGHAKALLAIDPGDERLRLARLCRSRGLSVREVERRAQGAAAARQRSRRRREQRKRPSEAPEVRALREQAERHFGSPVVIERDKSGRGRVAVTFFGDDDLDRVLTMMGVNTTID